MEVSQMLAVGIQKLEDLFEPVTTLNKGKNSCELALNYIVQSGIKVMFLKQDETIEDFKDLHGDEKLKRLYVFTNFEKDGRLNFKYHLEARIKKDVEENYTESELEFDNPKPTLRFSYAKHNFIVEGYEFDILMDGTINWK